MSKTTVYNTKILEFQNFIISSTSMEVQGDPGAVTACGWAYRHSRTHRIIGFGSKNRFKLPVYAVPRTRRPANALARPPPPHFGGTCSEGLFAPGPLPCPAGENRPRREQRTVHSSHQPQNVSAIRPLGTPRSLATPVTAGEGAHTSPLQHCSRSVTSVGSPGVDLGHNKHQVR